MPRATGRVGAWFGRGWHGGPRFEAATRWLTGWMRRSLGARIVGLFLGLLLVVQVASFTAIRASLLNEAQRELPAQLDVGDRVLQNLIDQQAQRLIDGAEVAAADYAFREAVATNDAETIGSVLANHAHRIKATEAALFGTDWKLRAATGQLRNDTALLVARLGARALDPRASGHKASEIVLLGGQPYQVVMVPMKAPVVVGWVMMGFPIDDRLLADMTSLAPHGVAVTLLTRADAAADWQVRLSRLSAAQAAALAREHWQVLPGSGSMASVQAAGEALGVHAHRLTQAALPPSTAAATDAITAGPLGDTSAARAASAHASGPATNGHPADEVGVLALISISIDDAVRVPATLQSALLAITLLGIAAFGVGSVLTARRVTTPLRRLTQAADRLGAGDLDTPIRGVRRHDEIGRLSQAFEQMRINVGNQKAEILKLAYWDTLTGLPNRAQFRDAVRDAVAEAAAADPAGAGPIIVAAGAVPGALAAAGPIGAAAAPAGVQPKPTPAAAAADLPAAHGGDAAGDGAIPSCANGSVAVIMLDLDRFKHVNDVLGYHFGDVLLTRVAERLSRKGVRGGDIVARLGGDKFAVLLRGGDAVLAASVAQRIERAFDEPLLLEEHKVDMGAGIGIACFPQHAADVDSLMSRAEVAMYAAKRRGSGALLYDPSIDVASAQTLSLLTELRQAVGGGELRLYLQPKLALDTARVVGAEALVRWQHPLRGLVPPVHFIPFAEQTGFIRVLTMWVFEEAARHWLALHAEGIRLVVSINLSTRDLLDPDLPKKFDALLVKHRVPAEGFCLEITESAIMDDPQRALGTLERLSAAGFKLSIDDFGTGYSSLAYLKKLPVDELKIDQSFVRSMESDLDDAKIVRSTIDLAHNLGLTVVAEGVENAHAWDMLRDLNCDEAQGYHMGKPMPAADFIGWSAGWLAKHAPRSAASALVLH